MADADLFLQTGRILDIDIESGRGVYLFDKQGKRYLDALSGVGVNALGHQHPKINAAISAQMNRNLHLFGYFMQDVHVDLARMILNHTHFDRLFYTNSGTESTEGVLKILKKWGNQHQRPEIVCLHGAFHGRTLGAMSVTDNPIHQQPFLPLLPNMISIPRDPVCLKNSVSERTAAVMFEVVSGKGGIQPLDQSYIDTVLELQHTYGFKIAIDEIQSGIGRTGKLFAYEHFGLKPDLVATAKGIGGGLPLGAILVTEEMAGVLSKGEHGSTFGGNPLSCATGRVVIDELLNGGLLGRVNEKGAYFRSALNALQTELPDLIHEIRNIGLMIGVDVALPAADVMDACIDAGLIVNATQGKTIRFLPPLIIEEAEIDEAIEIFRGVLLQFLNRATT